MRVVVCRVCVVCVMFEAQSSNLGLNSNSLSPSGEHGTPRVDDIEVYNNDDDDDENNENQNHLNVHGVGDEVKNHRIAPNRIAPRRVPAHRTDTATAGPPPGFFFISESQQFLPSPSGPPV